MNNLEDKDNSESPRYIIIKDWNDFHSLRSKSPEWKAVPRRDFRYGNAENVCLWTRAMEDFLKLHSIRYSLVED